MKRACFILVCIFLIISFSACINNKPDSDCKLIVNGVDITEGCFLRIFWDDYYAEVPVLKIFEALGAEVIREPGLITDTEVITVNYNDYSLVLDTQKEDFGLKKPEWMDKYVRRVVNGEPIVDTRSVSALLYHVFDAEIQINYAESTIHITSLDPSELQYTEEQLAEVNCRLIVNGTDITEGNYVRINHEQKNTELPILAISRALGAEINWLPCEPYPIKECCIVEISYGIGCLYLDTSKPGFQFLVPEDTPAQVRKLMGKEIIMDGNSIEGPLHHGFGIEILVDYENSIIYIDE